MSFDKRLLAIANCSVVQINKEKNEYSGGIIFDPYPVINATDDLVLSHEICHLLAGKEDYDIFYTALKATDDNPIFKFILNILYDWYHENIYQTYSFLLMQNLNKLHDNTNNIKINEQFKKSKELLYLINMYKYNTETPESIGIKNVKDLVFLAFKLHIIISKKISKTDIQQVEIILKSGNGTGAGSSTYGNLPKNSNYYATAVSKYETTISILTKLWAKDKYQWLKKHYGEIDWKNLIPTYIGEKTNLPVFLVLNKLIFDKNVYICIDRSGSTSGQLSQDIMDISIILTESLYRNKAKISIIDVGVQDKIINDINSDIPFYWFTPQADGGTELGKVLLTINEKSPKSLLLVITDGCPNNWYELQQAIKRFPGNIINFIIGNSFRDYNSKISNCISVTPSTLLEELVKYINTGNLL